MSEKSWDEITDGLRETMDRMHQSRETALSRSRALIQTCSKSIRATHRHEFDQASKLLEDARKISVEARATMAEHPEILYAGYLQDAEKEMVEAAAVLAMAIGDPIPTRDDLGVQAASYLNGMGEAASECRRYVLDLMRHGQMPEAERMLAQMEAIYDVLITFDYPDGLTGGLRRTCDALRAVIERTRSDLTMTLTQRELMEELRRARGA